MLNGQSTVGRGVLVGQARKLIGLVLSASLIGLLAALPSAPAQASPTTVTSLPTAEVESLLGETPLSALQTAELTEVLAKLPGLGGIEATALEGGLKKTIEALTVKGDTLEQLLSGGEAPTMLAAKLKEALGVFGGLLETLLGGNPVSKLTTALESAGPQQVLGELLNGSAHPETVVDEVLSALNPAKLETLLGSSLGGEAASALDVGQLAEQVGTTVKGLAESLGVNPSSLPETALALTKPLTNGNLLGLLDGAGGITLSLLNHAVEAEGKKGSGEGGTGGGGGGGSSGGSGGLGGSGTSPTVTIVEGSSTVAPAGAATTPAAKTIAKKVRIVSHKVNGHRATVVVEIPAAGTLSTSGRGIRATRRTIGRAERVTLHLTLTKAGVASVRRAHRKTLRLPLKVSFRPTAGASSTASASLTFR